MNNKKVAVVGMVLVLIVLIGYKFSLGRASQETSEKELDTPEVHYHAGFVVFDNEQKVDFTDLKYMDIEPCTLHTEEEEDTPEHDQLEKAHLHDGVGDVVHTHREGAKWGDLFTNIKYPLDYSKVAAYVNGQKIDDLQNYFINEDDSVVIFIGSIDEELLKQAVTVEHIKEVEGRSETCGS